MKTNILGSNFDWPLVSLTVSAIPCWSPILPFSGFYFTGDGALRDKDGDYRITGRMDDVINVSGKRLGTAEIEDAMVSNDCFKIV